VLRILFFIIAIFGGAHVFALRVALAANDPTLLWQSIETAHFRISFYSGEREAAERIADLAEAIYERLTPAVGWKPSGRTEIVLTDQTDSANGSATALPFNTVRLYLTAPDDLSPLGDVDDWYLELLTHEFTHILHTDHIRGIPALLNAIMGKTFAPNQAQPRWILEGLAIFEESARTSGGRLRSSQWNMYMRADVLENNFAGLDQFSNTPRRWPQGNLWYLYGSYFTHYIAETYGEQALRQMSHENASQLVPWGINRAIRRATGRTYEEMYPVWKRTLEHKFEAQLQAIRARGLREGFRITHHGQSAEHPRFVPDAAWAGHGGDVLYYRDDGHSTPGLYRLPLVRDAGGRVTGSRERDEELVVRTAGLSNAAFLPDGSVVFDSTDITKNLFAFGDLHRLPAGKTSPSGLEGVRTRLTRGFRASQVDVSPDGLRVAFVSNHRGTSYLQIADIGPSELTNVRNIVPSATFEQAFSPRWSPDNRHLAYSAWTHGGYRDVRIVDTEDGSFVNLTGDRAVDGGPSYSPDGSRLYFHSDRTGVMNVYAYDVATGALAQVTNVINGAYQPQVSKDGKTLVYLGYTHAGFDLFAMDLDTTRFLSAEPYVDDRPSPPPEPPRAAHVIKPYNPLHTLVPRTFTVRITPGNFGQASIVNVTGGDVAGIHGVAASLTTEWNRPELQPSLTYYYARLPVDLTLRVYRAIAPRAGFAIGPSYQPLWIQESSGLETSASYNMPGAFDGQSVAISHSVARLAGEFPFPTNRLDPYETPVVPQRGIVSFVSLAWNYTNAQRFLWSIGPERGFALSASISVTDPAIASEFSGYSATANAAMYVTMPWLQHHALALHGAAGASGGSYPGRGNFYVGGFVDQPVVDTVRNIAVQGGIVLRGYPVVALSGRNYALFNAEYRFPIVNIDRGISTLPIFMNRITGSAFVDYGSAFDDTNTAQFKTGVGGELWFDFQLAYVLSFTFRAGFAKGLASLGIDKTYFVASVPY
jgi:hypothetical protein